MWIKQNKLNSSTLHLSKTDDPEVSFSFAKEFMERGIYEDAIMNLLEWIWNQIMSEIQEAEKTFTQG